jgi:hypothetical protein
LPFSSLGKKKKCVPPTLHDDFVDEVSACVSECVFDGGFPPGMGGSPSGYPSGTAY